MEWGGQIDYIEFPQHLKGSYQDYTCADLSNLRGIGYDAEFAALETGIPNYLSQLGQKRATTSIGEGLL